MENNSQKTELKTITLAELWTKSHISGISTLNFNQNSYPFLTITRGNSATNVYFSKSVAKTIEEQGFVKGQDLIQNKFLLSGEIAQTTNEDQESRFKIILPSLNGKYSSKSELNSAFGAQENTNFDLATFISEFQTAEQNAVKVVQESQAQN